MQPGRQTLGYVVEVDGAFVTINLEENVRSHVSGHVEGISSFEQPGDLIAIEAGSNTLIARVLTLSFAEPRELHHQRWGHHISKTPLRQLKGCVIGLLARREGKLEFQPQTTRLPALGAQALPLSGTELRAALSGSAVDNDNSLCVGGEARNPSIRVSASLDQLLSRHLAVLGATGQGKTHFVADLLQQMADKKPRSRVVIFDLNGEYYPAFSYLAEQVKYTAIGDRPGRNAPKEESRRRCMKIPYYALGRPGLFRLLLPSEKTQAPALRFAIEHLPFVGATESGAWAAGGNSTPVLFDDCRSGDASAAHNAIIRIRSQTQRATEWPHLRALSSLVAESYAIEFRNGAYQRNSFNYGHIQPLVSRVNSLISDSHFNSVVDVAGGPGRAQGDLNLGAEAASIVQDIFGEAIFAPTDPKIHIVDLSQLAQDLMPIVLGPLLELLAEQLFRRGPGKTHPTLLVLEEAHHYLRQLAGDNETGQHALAYERLAKEGRKFGLSLLVSTQRPSELSPTVLAQCGTWAVFRLTNEADKRAVTFATEDSGSMITNQLAGLARGEALVFGAAFRLPIRITRDELPSDRRPDSLDPPFEREWAEQIEDSNET